jgi:DNA-binding NtrC family response regulator
MNTTLVPEPSSQGQPPARWILVVDDEPAMRSLIEIVLQGQGWNVRTAGGAEEAMDTIRASSEPPAVVVCDVLMPGVDGLELTRRMCARVPGLSVIFISGHLTDVSWWPSDLREHRFLAKPFENVFLVDAVRDALNDITPPPR